MGSSGAGGWPRRSGRAAGAWLSWAGWPASSARTLVTASRSLAAGCSNGVSWNPSASALVLAPRPSTYRPPQTWWRVAAVIASVAGVRPQTDRTPEASLDPGGAQRDLGQHRGRVQSPALGHREDLIPQLVGEHGGPDDDIPPGLHRREPHAAAARGHDAPPAASAGTGRGTVSHTALAAASTSPPGPSSADPAVSLRPSRPPGQAITRHWSPAHGQRRQAGRHPAEQDGGVLAQAGGLGGGDPAGTIQRRPDHFRPHPPVRARDRGVRCPRRRPQRPARHRPGEDPQPVARPGGSSRRQSSRGRPGPCSSARRPAAMRASAIETGPGISSAGRPGEEAASAISVRPWWMRSEPSSPRSTAIGVASGGGRRSVTVTGPSSVRGDASADVAAVAAAGGAAEAGRDDSPGIRWLAAGTRQAAAEGPASWRVDMP